MASAPPRPSSLTPRPLVRDPAVTFTALVLWLLVGLFVVYPLAMLLARVAFDNGTFSLAGLDKVVTDR